MKEKLVLSEAEKKELDLFLEDFDKKGGMTTEELIQRLNAIPFEEFIDNLRKKVCDGLNDNIKSQ